MMQDSHKWWHYLVSTIYFFGVLLFGWLFFVIGPWRQPSVILEIDHLSKRIKYLKTCGHLKILK
jgi:hypothetical protein